MLSSPRSSYRLLFGSRKWEVGVEGSDKTVSDCFRAHSGPGVLEWAERGSEPEEERTRRSEFQLLTWEKGETKIKSPFPASRKA